MTDLFPFFETEMQRLGLTKAEPFFAISVSGGVDSMVLSHLLMRYCQKYHGRLLGVTVDHHLRASSRQEALGVHDFFVAHQAEHQILDWHATDREKKSMQKYARVARYRMMQDVLQQKGVSDLFIAHHQDDQVETYLLRQQKKSGVMGLACMSAIRSVSPWMRFVRPLLSVRKAQLYDYARHFSIPWWEDESNQSSTYLRNEIRLQHVPDLSEDERNDLVQRIKRHAQNRQKRDQEMALFLQEEGCGLLSDCEAFSRDRFVDLSEELQLWVIRRLCHHIGGKEYLPSEDESLELCQALKSEGFRGKTLAGTHVYPRHQNLCFVREARNISRHTFVGQEEMFFWDRRYWISGSAAPEISVGVCDPQTFADQSDFAALREIFGYRVFKTIPVVFLTNHPHIINYRFLNTGGFWHGADGALIKIMPQEKVWKNLFTY